MNFVFFVVVTLIFGVSSQQFTCSIEEQCGNPMCSKTDLWWGYWSHMYLPEPQYSDASDVCPYFYNNNNEKQCCDNSLYTTVVERFVDVVSDVEKTVTAVEKAKNYWHIATQKWTDEKQKIVTNDSVDSVTKANVTKLIDNVIAAYSTLMDNGVRNWEKCAQGILKYWIGLICFSCSSYCVILRNREIQHL